MFVLFKGNDLQRWDFLNNNKDFFYCNMAQGLVDQNWEIMFSFLNKATAPMYCMTRYLCAKNNISSHPNEELTEY